MRGSSHSGRTTAKGQAYNVNHNDRNYTSEIDEHVDKDLSRNNVYMTADMEHDFALQEKPDDVSLREHELQIYEELFRAKLDDMNERAIASRHPERVKTMEDYYTSSRTCPEEIILQIGKHGEFDDMEKFKAVMDDYIKAHQEKFPDVKILDYSIHADEPGAGIHAHLRKVYVAQDEHNLASVSQHKCLEGMGYTLPDPEQARGQYNNLKIPHSQDLRELWLDTCQRHEIDLERVAQPLSHKTLEKLDYSLKSVSENLITASDKLEQTKREYVQALYDKVETRRELSKLQTRQNELNGSIEACEDTLWELQRSVTDTAYKLQDIREQTETASQDYADTSQKLSEAQINLEQVNNDIEAQEQAKKRLEAKIKASEEELQKIQGDVLRSKEVREVPHRTTLTGKVQLDAADFRKLQNTAAAIDQKQRDALEMQSKAKSIIDRSDEIIKEAKAQASRTIGSAFEMREELAVKESQLLKFEKLEKAYPDQFRAMRQSMAHELEETQHRGIHR